VTPLTTYHKSNGNFRNRNLLFNTFQTLYHTPKSVKEFKRYDPFS